MPQSRINSPASPQEKLLERLSREGLYSDEVIISPEENKDALKKITKDLPPEERELVDYLLHRARIRLAYKESGDWSKIISTLVYKDEPEAQEAFIDEIEATYKVTLKGAEHLRDIANINTEGEGPGETLEGLRETIINARENRYLRALQMMLRAGATYKDLLSTDPAKYNLPKNWSGFLDKNANKERAIKQAIFYYFSLDSPSYFRANLRDIANIIEAPYSVIMDAFDKYPIRGIKWI